jgi:type VI secretion system protein ImpA
LVEDYPELPKMLTTDDTATANSETQAWILEQVAPPKQEAPPAEQQWAPMQTYEPSEPSTNGEGGEPAAPDAFQLAQEAAMSGNKSLAVEILTREVGNERCGRGRFQRRMQLAQICLSVGHEVIARPILEELAREIETRKLEEWETGDLVAHALALLYRCVDKDQDEQRRKLYAWICRLDPVQALACVK